MRAIIFDMDGVLVDSMPYHAEAWKQALASADVHIEKKDIYELEGSNNRQLVEKIFRRFGRTPTEDDIKRLISKKVELFNRIEHVKPFSGMKELLESLKPEYKLAVVSGTDSRTVHDILNSFFPGIFDVVIDGDDIKEGKPSPAPYLKAVEKLGIPKEDCIVIENAPLGVRSAKSAGLRCIAIPTYLNRESLKEADVIADSHKDLGKYIHEEAEREAKEENKKGRSKFNSSIIPFIIL